MSETVNRPDEVRTLRSRAVLERITGRGGPSGEKRQCRVH